MTLPRLFPIAPLFALLMASAVGAREPIQFNRDIRPILSDKCFFCHGPDSQTREEGLRLDIEQNAKEDLGEYAAITGGHPDKSEIIRRIQESDADLRMPPISSGKRITAEELETLRAWIAEGAQYQNHWAFEPIRRPETQNWDEASPSNPIDLFIRAQLKKAGLSPSTPAPPTTQLRRVTLDLTGLPPTIEQADDYLAMVDQDGIDAAYSAVVDKLLSSPRFGEHMAWSWLEAARYADTDGYQNDGPREMWRWRDWVIDAFNQNMPFDQFTIEQLAGDLLPNPTHEQLIATAFNRNHRYNSEAGIPIDEFLLENAVDRVDTTSTVWMGLTMGCARCHDHKFDPLSQREYYKLIDYFNDVAESGRAIKLGNSEPWIKTPTRLQRDQLRRLDADIAAAELALREAEAEIADAQSKWEAKAAELQPVLSRDLDGHWTFDKERLGVEFAKSKSKPELQRGVFGEAVSVTSQEPLLLDPIDGLIGNGRFSISLWVKPNQINRGAILSNENRNTQRAGILLEIVDGKLRWNIIGRWIAGVQSIETRQPINNNEWIHVALTNDGTQRTDGMAIYINGQRQAVSQVHNTNSNTKGRQQKQPMQIGNSHHVAGWSGSVDELRFFTTRTLSSDEIQMLAVGRSPRDIASSAFQTRDQLETQLLRRTYLEQTKNELHRKLLDDLRAAQAKRTEFNDRLPTTMIMRDLDNGRASYVRLRGVYDQLGDEVTAGTPDVFPALGAGDNNRLAFARWLVSPDHPLTARVTVNRIWQSFFGRGIVKTAGDFGSQGAPPTHPQLLDWLAAEFIESGWNLKQLTRKIVLSETYRQSSAVDPAHQRLDPNNILLSRAPAIRLPGNMLRDQALAVSGLLVESSGGPSVKPYQPKGLWREASNFSYSIGKGDDLYRRSLYTYWKRTLAPPTMAILDTGDREYCTVKPKRTNTPLQALALLNDVTFVEAARKLAERVLREGGDGDRQRVTNAFRRVATRHPTDRELEILVAALDDYRADFQAQPAMSRKLLNSGSSKADPTLDAVALAAMTALANVLLNLDEVTTRE